MLSNHPNCLGGNGPSASSDLIGDVDGPASATDNAVARFDGTTGKLIQNSTVTIDDSGNITPSGSVHGANGSAANPSFAFNSDQNTGLYRIGADNIGVSANGAKVLDIATTGLTVTGALGASSLTSPAATNLTLAGGAGNSSIILTPAGTGNVGIGVTPSAWSGINALEMTAGTSLAANATLPLTFLNTNCYFNGANWIYKTSNYANLYIMDGTEGKHKWFRAASGTAGNAITLIEAMTMAPTGDVSIASTTAGASNAGALVVAGGISGGNTGAASYFGGAVTVASAGLSTFGSGGNTVEITPSASGRVVFKKEAGYDAYVELAGNGNIAGTSSLVIGQGGADVGVLYNRKNAALSFGTNGTERLSISAAGAATFAGAVTVGTDVTLTNGNLIVASGKGIDFSATAGTGTSELLNDYEEGTWTPTLTPITSGTITLGSPNLCAYTKIGRVVTVNGLIDTASVSTPIGGSVSVNNLPFTSNATATQRSAGTAACLNMTSGFVSTACTIVQSTTTMVLQINASLFQTGSAVFFQLTYIV